MFLALKEIRRAKARFALLISAVGLLVFLILFQQTLQSGLVTSFVGAIENQSAPVIAYSVDGRRNLQGGVVLPELEEAIRGAEGIGAVARLGQTTVNVQPSDQGDGAPDGFSLAVIGYEDPALGAPTTVVEGRLPEGPGEIVATEADAADGLDIGERVRVEPGGLELEVVGLARDASLFASPTAFTTYATYAEVVAAGNPDARAPLPNALVLSPAEGVTDEELVEAVNATGPEADALTRADAAAAAPGVGDVTRSFQIILGLFGLVVPIVTGLFFLIVTFQKAGALTLLRAVGIAGRRLVWSLLAQVLVIMVAGLALGTLLYLPLSFQRVGSIPLRFQTDAVVVWWVVLLGLGVVSSLVAAKRVLRIDPIEATTGAEVR